MKIKLIEGGKLPEKMTEGAACYDVYVREIEVISRDCIHVKLGFAATPPEGFKLVLVPRSSITKTNWIMQNSPGIGDSDFTHEYQMRFRAIPDGAMYWDVILNKDGEQHNDVVDLLYPQIPFKVGERVGQMFLEKVYDINFEIVDELEETNRLGGFGSTNK